MFKVYYGYMLSYIELSKENLYHNIYKFKEFLHPKTKIIAIVKANAYGHGLREIVESSKVYIYAFGVNTIEEARVVRSLTNKEIFIFGYVPLLDIEKVLELKVNLGVYNKETIQKLNIVSKRNKTVTPVYIKIDALLGRQGILVNELPSFLLYLKSLKNIRVRGLYAHFANIEDTSDFSHAQKQIDLLHIAENLLQKNGLKSVTTHISATSGVLEYEQDKGLHQYVRIGIGLYGLWPSKGIKNHWEHMVSLKPIMRWVTHVAQVKTLPKGHPVGYGLTYITQKSMRVAVIPQGYSDGYDRRLSNIGEVLIRGRRCPVLGRVAMNMFVVGVSHVPNIGLEDEVVLLGKQGNEEITIDEVAEKIGTINYEVVSRISPLLPRVAA